MDNVELVFNLFRGLFSVGAFFATIILMAQEA